MILRKNTDAFFGTALDDEMVLLNVHSGHFQKLSDVALAVWNAIDGIRTLGEIQATIADHYDVDRETCFAEVAAFVEELRREKFIDDA